MSATEKAREALALAIVLAAAAEARMVRLQKRGGR